MNDRWTEAIGGSWRLMLAALGVLVFVFGFLQPLFDPDLPMHLATGEWIVQHGRLPTVEPFAWTRAGAPFYAYSWLQEVLYYWLLQHFGAWALQLLQGALILAVPASVVLLGRVAGWRPWTALLLAFMSFSLEMRLTPSLRPKLVLWVLLPLAWMLVYHGRRATRVWPTALGMTCVGALAANSHFLFPLTAGPLALLVTDPPPERRRTIVLPLALVVGWLLTPNTLDWAAIYQLNLGDNAMLRFPTPIREFQPGIIAMAQIGAGLEVALFLLVLPWLLPVGSTSGRERLVFGAFWLGGLGMFAAAVRALDVPWLLLLPMSARALDEATDVRTRFVRCALAGILFAFLGAAVVHAASEWRDPTQRAGSVTWRYVPSPLGRPAEPLAQWLDEGLRPEARGRLLTVFSLGSHLTWRLPRLSPSIDGRTIFPDSASAADTYSPADGGALPLPPWRAADVAIVPLGFRVAAVLDTAAGWKRVGGVPATERMAGIGLWVREAWWAEAGQVPLPSTPIRFPVIGGSTGMRAAIAAGWRRLSAGLWSDTLAR